MPYRTKSVVRLFLKVRHGARKRVPNVQVDSVVVGLFGSGGSVVPQSALQPLVLTHKVDGAVTGVTPHGLIETERDFVDRAVLTGTRVAIADRLAGGVDRHIAADVNPAIVGIEQGPADGGFHTVDGAGGVQGAKVAIGPNNEVGCLAEQ